MVNYFKNKQKENHNFLPSLVRKCGYPIWNKTINYYPKNLTGRSSTEGTQDSVIQLPFVQENTTIVNSFVEAVLNDSINIDLFEKEKYVLLPKGNIDATTLTAEKYINQFFMLQNRVFNHHFFKILDTTLFKTTLPTNSAKAHFINIEEVVNNGNQTNSFGVTGCFSYKTYYSTMEGTDINPIVVRHVVHHLICFPSVQSFLNNDVGSGVSLGSIGALNWASLLTGGTSAPTGTNGTYNGPNGNGSNGYGTTTTIGFIDEEELYMLSVQLKNLLPNILDEELGFFLDHSNQLREIVNYLTANNTLEAKEIIYKHINKLINDLNYLNLVLTHTNTSSSNTVWWADNVWLSNPQNQALLFDPNNPFDLIEFPVNIPDVPVIDYGITISSPDPTLPTSNWPNIASVPSRGNVEDMQYGTNGDGTGINSNVISKSDAQLFAEMQGLFNYCTMFDIGLQHTGWDFIYIFRNNNGGTVSNITLDDRVKSSSAFKNFVSYFGNEFSKKLKLLNGQLYSLAPPPNGFPISIPLEKRPIFNGSYNRWHGLQILINDTEYTTVDLDSYTADAQGNYKANITVTIYDHFGLDKNDALTYQSKHDGFPSWWVLQHQRGYVPFETKIQIKLKIEGNYNFAIL